MPRNAAAKPLCFRACHGRYELLGCPGQLPRCLHCLLLMLGCSYAFINPAGYQTDLMVQEPGKYSFFDYVKLGVPLTLVAGIVAMLLVPLFYPF